MQPWDNFRLVSGYLPEIDYLPEAARKLQLPCRVAAVLNDNDVPHSPWYWEFVDALVECIPADSVTFEIGVENDLLVFTSVSLMREFVDGRPDINIPFDRATFYQCGRAVAFIEVEAWNMTGGPAPYHDSWTFAIYRTTDDMTQLRDACYRVFAKHELPVLEEMSGLAAPQLAPRWKRLVRWLLR